LVLDDAACCNRRAGAAQRGDELGNSSPLTGELAAAISDKGAPKRVAQDERHPRGLAAPVRRAADSRRVSGEYHRRT
jgi:hypothetical protein